MAGGVAVRELRAGSANLDPCGERSSAEDEEDDSLDDVEGGPGMTLEEERKYAEKAKGAFSSSAGGAASRWEQNASPVRGHWRYREGERRSPEICRTPDANR